MKKEITARSIVTTLGIVFIFSMVLGLIMLSPRPHPNKSNVFQFPELFDTPFQQLPGTFVSYHNSDEYVDFVLSSSGFEIEPEDILGLLRNDETNIILIASENNITEIIADEEGNIQKTSVMKLEPVDSKEFLINGKLTERIVIELYELDIPLLNSNDSDTASALRLSHESWENKAISLNDKNSYMRVEGMFFADISDNIAVTGTSSEVLANSILLSVSRSNDETQDYNFSSTYSNSAKWRSKGLFISSKSTRETQIRFDRNLNIETWVTGDSWIGMGS